MTFSKWITCFVCFFAGLASAQSPKGSQSKEQVLFSMPVSTKQRQIIFGDRATRETASQDQESSASELSREEKRWGRLAGGLYASLSNYSILKSHFHVTEDKVLFGHASQKNFGLGVHLDFLHPGTQDLAGWRLRGGFSRISLKPDARVKANFSSSLIENSATALDFAGLYRWVPGFDLGSGVPWLGVGLHLSQIIVSHHQAKEAAAVSHLANSFGLSALLALGADFQVSDESDVGFELDWMPRSGWGLLANWRTSL